MKPLVPVLGELARRYERSKAGRTGNGARGLLVDYEELLAAADAAGGEARVRAERDLADAERAGLIVLLRHRRDRRHIEQIRFSSTQESALYAALGALPPASRREALAQQFQKAGEADVPAGWKERWRAYCLSLADAALEGRPVAPFDRNDLPTNTEILALIPRILSWPGESLIRFVSCVLCGRSKRLEELEPKLTRICSSLRGEELESLESFGIVRQPRMVFIHGPLRLRFGKAWLDLANLAGAVRLSEVDVTRADEIVSSATRCITIENDTSFHEIAKLQSGDLLVQTSYPGAATRTLLCRITGITEFWHFGDSDPNGFDILRILRQQTNRPLRSFHMRFRACAPAPKLSADQRRLAQTLLGAPELFPIEKEEISKMLAADSPGRFEQESLLRPSLSHWPFYEDVR